MNPPPQRARRLPILAAAALLAVASTASTAQGPAHEGVGIDLVFLVDVSGSMSPHPQGLSPGNDPQRIRWDAVLLSMNLLTAEDKVLVIPFNHDAPAKHEYYPTVAVPGSLNGRLVDPRSDDGAKDRFKVRSFIREGNFAINQADLQKGEWNGDNGGTAILFALQEARARLGNPAPGRRRSVILLTDGNEEIANKKPAGLDHLKQLKDAGAIVNDPRLAQWLGRYAAPGGPGEGLKVYTIGLGSQFDDRLLKLIARKTGGHYEHVPSNGALIETFRGLIWQLKDCWTKTTTIGPNRPDHEDDLMAGISDHGALFYQVVPGDKVRNASKLAKGNEFTFGGKPSFEADEASYGYNYYDDRELAEGTKLTTTWNPSASDRRLLFSKRTARPLFTPPDLGRDVFQRLQARPLRVRMDVRSIFRPSDFKVEAMVSVAGEDRENVPPILRADLDAFDATAHEFHGDLDLSGLPSRGGESDDYTLTIRVTGKKAVGEDFSLRDYVLQLPPVDFRVENRLRLMKAGGPIRIDNKLAAKKWPITIQPVIAFRAGKAANPPPLRVEVKKQPVVPLGRPVEIARVVDAAVPFGKNAFDQLEGRIELVLAENPGEGEFTGGELLISSSDDRSFKVEPLTIPFDVEIQPILLGLSRRPVLLEYKMAGPEARSGPIQVWANGAVMTAGQSATVSIPDHPPFASAELWIEAANAPRTKLSTLRVRPTDRFEIVFKPKEDLQTFGSYTFEMIVKAEAPGYKIDPLGRTVRLRYNAPTIESTGPARVFIQRGGSADLTLQVGLRGGVPVGRQVSFSGEALPEKTRLRPGERSVAELAMDNDGPLGLTAGDPPRPQPFPIRITAPRSLECGQYQIKGELTANLTDPVPVVVSATVNDLILTDRIGRPIPDSTAFYPIKGTDLTEKVRVFADWGDLKPDDVELPKDEEPLFTNDQGSSKRDVRVEVVSKEGCRDESGRKGVEIGLKFRGLSTSFERYRTTLTFRSKETGMKKAIDCAVRQVEILASPK